MEIPFKDKLVKPSLHSGWISGFVDADADAKDVDAIGADGDGIEEDADAVGEAMSGKRRGIEKRGVGRRGERGRRLEGEPRVAIWDATPIR